MDTLLETTLKTLLGFAVLLLLTRILGKKQLSQMTFFTYITGIALGGIAGDVVVHHDIKLLDGLLALTLWSFLSLVVEWISMKSSKARILLDGEPTIVIKRGRIVQQAMKDNKLNMDDLSMLLRLNGVFSVSEVHYAILEPNGQLSVLQKPPYRTPTRQDLDVPAGSTRYMPTELIVDGAIVERNLRELGLDKTWLLYELQKQGITDERQVFFAELQEDGGIFIDK
ncbi:membrane protein [Paenibacillus swuensis]|uniref:Membrane protein n=1 Tax=Paenibacillus swuensis TaxID=1178515 RepID=A0A172TLF6_9BACL|nr:DUF421 domain-containing protein [Paenibacillus swuensis]ANE47899.1 membrane protein [Paenibacillus swuensis]